MRASLSDTGIQVVKPRLLRADDELVKTRQRIVLCAGLFIATVAALFPPWIEQHGSIDIAAHGLSWVLWARPTEWDSMRPDYGRLGVEWAAIAALTGCAFVAAGGQKKEGRLG